MRIQIFSLITLALFLLSCSPKIPSKGLVAHYPFDGNAMDKSPFLNHGKVFNADLTKGRNKEAYYFDGYNSFIKIQNAKSLQIEHEITVSAWFKTKENVPYAAILCQANKDRIRSGYIIGISKQKIRTDIINNHQRGLFGITTSNKKINDNEWHHVVSRYDGTFISLFIDGLLIEEKRYTDGLKASNSELLIGRDYSTWLSRRYFKGLIDDVRIYNRSLSDKEVQNLFNE